MMFTERLNFLQDKGRSPGRTTPCFENEQMGAIFTTDASMRKGGRVMGGRHLSFAGGRLTFRF